MWQQANSQFTGSEQMNMTKIRHNLSPIENSNELMSQSYKFPLKCNVNMHDPEYAPESHPQKENIFIDATCFADRSESKGKPRIRMYGSKRSLFAYTALLTANQTQSKLHSENEPATSNHINPSMLALERPFSHSHDRNKKKVIGCRKKVPPSLTMIDPGTSTEIKSNWREIKSHSSGKNNFNLKILNKDSNKALRKHGEFKPKVIGRQIKISAHIDEISIDFEKIDRLRITKIQSKPNQNESDMVSACSNFRSKKDQSTPPLIAQEPDDFNLHNVMEAQKKFLYDQEPVDSRAGSKQVTEQPLLVQQNENKQGDGFSLGASCEGRNENPSIKEVKSETSENLNTKACKPTSIKIYPKIPSVVLTPSKKIKAHIDYIESDKQPRPVRYGHFLEEKHPVQILILNKSIKAHTNLIEEQQSQQSMSSINQIRCETISNKKQSEKGRILPQNSIKSIAADPSQLNRQDCPSNSECSNQLLQKKPSSQKRPSIILSSHKNIQAQFDFIESEEPAANQDYHSAGREKTLIKSGKSVEAYFEYINYSGEHGQDQMNNCIKQEIDSIIQSQISQHCMRLHSDQVKLQSGFSHQEVSSSKSIIFAEFPPRQSSEDGVQKNQENEQENAENSEQEYVQKTEIRNSCEKQEYAHENSGEDESRQQFSVQEDHFQPTIVQQVLQQLQTSTQKNPTANEEEDVISHHKSEAKDAIQMQTSGACILPQNITSNCFQLAHANKLSEQAEQATFVGQERTQQKLQEPASIKAIQEQNEFCDIVDENGSKESSRLLRSHGKEEKLLVEEQKEEDKGQNVKTLLNQQVIQTECPTIIKQNEDQKQFSGQNISSCEKADFQVGINSLKLLLKKQSAPALNPINSNEVGNDDGDRSFLKPKQASCCQLKLEATFKCPSGRSATSQQNKSGHLIQVFPSVQGLVQQKSSKKIIEKWEQKQKNPADDALVEPSGSSTKIKQSRSVEKQFLRSSKKKVSNLNSQNQPSVIKKVGIYKFKESKENVDDRTSHFRNDNQRQEQKQQIEVEQKSSPKSSGFGSRTYSPLPKKHKNSTRIKISSPYLSSAFSSLKLDSSKNEKLRRSKHDSNRELSSGKKEHSAWNIKEEENDHQPNKHLKKESLAKRNKRNLILNERKVERLRVGYQKIIRAEGQKIEHPDDPDNQSDQECQARLGSLPKIHSRLSYYESEEALGEQEQKLVGKNRQQQKKLKRTSYATGKRRESDEANFYVNKPRKDLEHSQKYLANPGS